ncbi:hypothetical protein O3G_MSEX011837 [Manduca sexta]|uniref:Arrestin C-terminal-like domain-containing protein n=1 Tax=Manduca sexta TaxID=7130 RepID=A0A921ZM50_MANSE|nr:hypothetical protein O3G_MSEX011837 [Manduca sexta]
MGVSCQILINKPKGGHSPGQSVNGVVKYALDQPLEVNCVMLSLIGKGYCRWSESKTVNKKRRTVYYTGKEEYYKTSINVIEKNSDEVQIIPVGSYEIPFEFFLPLGIPPSFKGYHGYVSHMLRLKFKRPGIFKIDKRFFSEFPVRSCINGEAEGPLVFGVEKTLTKPFSKRKHVVNLKVNIDKTSLTPEDKAHLDLVVTNDTSITITDIKSELIQRITYTANCGRTNVCDKILKQSTVKSTSIPNDAVANLRQEIATLPDMVSINTKVIKVEFKLRVTVRLPLPHLNAPVEIPIVIGEKLEREESPEDDPPPSYWEVMNEEEKVKE